MHKRVVDVILEFMRTAGHILNGDETAVTRFIVPNLVTGKLKQIVHGGQRPILRNIGSTPYPSLNSLALLAIIHCSALQ